MLAFAVRSAEAAPVFGAELFYTGGNVTVTSLPVSSAFVSELGLYDGTFTRVLYLTNDESPNVSVTFDPSAFGFAPGDELIFGIRVVDAPNVDPSFLTEYFLGPAGRNPDNVVHGAIDTASGVVVSFEDWLGGGDLDYNDVIFAFEGGIRPVPEPGTLALLALGLGGLRLARRRRV